MAGTGKAHLRNSPDVLLSVNDLVVEFPVARTGLKVNAVSGISFDVIKGETLGIVGGSGSDLVVRIQDNSTVTYIGGNGGQSCRHGFGKDIGE